MQNGNHIFYDIGKKAMLFFFCSSSMTRKNVTATWSFFFFFFAAVGAAVLAEPKPPLDVRDIIIDDAPADHVEVLASISVSAMSAYQLFP